MKTFDRQTHYAQTKEHPETLEEALHRLRKSEQIFRLTFEQVGTGMCQTDLDGTILDANQNFCDLIGYTKEEAIGLKIKDLTHPEDWEIDLVFKGQLFRHEIPSFSMEKRYFRKDGSQIWVMITVTLMHADSQSEDFLIGIIQDISEKKATEELLKSYTQTLEREIVSRTEELEALNAQLTVANQTKDEVIRELRRAKRRLQLSATLDPLTGLYNRRFMMDRIEEELARTKRSPSSKGFCLIVADLDYFKSINDELGHDCGDEILQNISRLLLEGIRRSDIVARWGGEEFLILLPETTIEDAKDLANRLRVNIMQEEFFYDNKSYSVTMTFGIAPYSPDKTIKETIVQADRALYIGKDNGRNCVTTY